MKRYVGGVAAAALVLGLGACGAGDGESDDPTTSSSATTSTDTGQDESSTGAGQDETSTAADQDKATTGASQDEMIGKLVSGEPPRDVLWMSGQPPAEWKKLDTETGTAQWQIADSSCIVTVTQPNGLGTQDNPTDDGLADEQVRRLAQAAKAKNVTTPEEGTVMVPAKIKDLDGRVEQKFTTRTFEADDGFTSLVWARRYGDFAMMAYAGCGGKEFDEAYDDSIKTFLESLVVTVTY